MILSSRIYFILTFLILIACNNFKSYSLEDLQKNSDNKLQLSVEKNFTAEKYTQLFENLKNLSKNELLQQLQSIQPELHQVSYSFYYLANSYAAEQQLDSAIICHEVAAYQYYNPQSYLKMAEWYFYREKQLELAYECLHKALELMVEITQNNPLHPLSKNCKNKLQFLLTALQKVANSSRFEEGKVRKKLKEILPKLLRQQKKMYQL